MSDPRFEAFVAAATPDVFHSVLSSDDVWRPDPLDVPEMHAEARERFDAMVATFIERRERGESLSIENRIMLLRGAAGTGKTHLMRAFRHRLHRTGRGFFAYLQMGVHVADYPRYILHNILESFSRPYNAELSNISSLEHLSRSLMAEARELGIDAVLDGPGDFDPELVAQGLTDRFEALAGVEPGVLSALLHLQRGLPSVSKFAVKYLRCEDLTSRQRAMLGDLPPMLDPESPMRVIGWLADAVAMTYDRPLVICIDQLDLFYADDPDAGRRFRMAVATLEALADNPNVLVVLSVLDEYYARLREALIGPQLQRLEGGQRSVVLARESQPEEVLAVFARRLAFLYEFAGTAADTSQPLYPFAADVAERLSGPPIRLALQAAHDARERSRATGLAPSLASDVAVPTGPSAVDVALADFDMAWNDFRFATTIEAPSTLHDVEHLLDAAVRMASRELGNSRAVRSEVLDGDLSIVLESAGHSPERILVALTNGRALFGRLAREIRSAAARAETHGAIPVFLRTDAFPRSTRTQIGTLLDDLRARGARTVTMTDLEMRTLASFRAFDLAYGMYEHYDAWLEQSKPITSLPGIIALLRLDGVQVARDPAMTYARRVTDAVAASYATVETGAVAAPFAVTPVVEISPQVAPTEAQPVHDLPASVTPISAVVTAERNAFDLGNLVNAEGRLQLDAARLLDHVAIVGSSTSGKSQLAFSLVERAIAAGLPAIVLDRTGALANAVADGAFERIAGDVDVYTPGNAFGRELSIATVPAGLDALARRERESEAHRIADGLGALMRYTAAKHRRIAALGTAIATLALKRPGRAFSLSDVIDFLTEKGMDLVEALGTPELAFLDPLIADLERLRDTNAAPLDADGDVLDVPTLLALKTDGAHRARLTLIDLSSFSHERARTLWVANFLHELSRAAEPHESGELRALVAIDDAHAYVRDGASSPVRSSTERLFARARAAGIGLVFASSTPLELPWRASERNATWLVGRTSRPTALRALIDVFGTRGVAALARLPQLRAGSFFEVRDTVATAFVIDVPQRTDVRGEERHAVGIGRELVRA